MDNNLCIITLALDSLRGFNSEFKVSEHKITRETPKKVYYEILDGLDESSVMKSKFNHIYWEANVCSICVRAICYSKDKETIKNDIFTKAQEKLDFIKKNANILENMFNEIKQNNI